MSAKPEPASTGGRWDHLVAICAGATIVFLIAGRGVPSVFEVMDEQPTRTALSWPLKGHLDTYKTEPFLSSLLARTLSDGSSIVLFGSSELTTIDQPAKAVNFFNGALGLPLLALGHAGSQSFAIHSQLISSGPELDSARIAILVSPSWFVDRAGKEGTTLSCFLEYNPSPSLYKVHVRLSEGDTGGVHVREFFVEHAKELGGAQPIVKSMILSGSSAQFSRYWFSLPWNTILVNRTTEAMLATPEPMPDPLGAIVSRTGYSPDWASLYAKGRAEHIAACTNNKVFVTDAYYSEHVNGATRQLEPVPLDVNREFAGFLDLLDYLKAKGARPVFIIQPLNPFVYTNLKEIDPTIVAIRKALDERAFAYLDLWTSDTARFEPGILTDVMHLGPVGWYRVDSMIMAHFQ